MLSRKICIDAWSRYFDQRTLPTGGSKQRRLSKAGTGNAIALDRLSGVRRDTVPRHRRPAACAFYECQEWVELTAVHRERGEFSRALAVSKSIVLTGYRRSVLCTAKGAEPQRFSLNGESHSQQAFNGVVVE